MLLLHNLSYTDLIYLLVTEQITPEECNFTPAELLDFELEVMATNAIKRAGNENLVHWAASDFLH